MNACVGAFAAASDGVGIAPAPMGAITGAAAGVIGASGPLTQQHAGRSSSDKRMVEIVVRMAIGFHGSTRRITAELFTKSAGFYPQNTQMERRLKNSRAAVPYHPHTWTTASRSSASQKITIPLSR